MKIRFAELKDMKQIISLCKEHAAYENAQYNAQNKEVLLTQYFFEPKASIKCIVVEKRDELVGYATFFKQFSTWDAKTYLYLDCLYLNENTRGQGIGFKLIEKVKEYALSENCSTIQWQTPSVNFKAISFYLKLGAQAKTKERFFLTIPTAKKSI